MKKNKKTKKNSQYRIKKFGKAHHLGVLTAKDSRTEMSN